MIWLAMSDISIHRRTLLFNVPTMVFMMLVLGSFMGPQAANGIPVVLIMMSAWAFSLRAAYEDDKADMWTFLRALPIPPSQIVGARFVSSAIVILAFTLLITIPMPLVDRAGTFWPWAVTTGAGIGLLITGLFNAAYFRLGYRLTATWFNYVFFLLFLPAVIPWHRLHGVPGINTFLETLAPAITWLETHRTAAITLAVVLVLCLWLASWAYATRAFRRKQLL